MPQGQRTVVGEVCRSPAGLAAMSRLASRRIAGPVPGTWLLAVSLGSFLAGFAAGYYETLPLPRLFLAIAAVALLAAPLMASAIRPIRALLSGGAAR